MGLACCVDTEQNERQTEKGAQSERFQTQPHWKSVFSFQWKQRNDDYSLNRVLLSWCVHMCVHTYSKPEFTFTLCCMLERKGEYKHRSSTTITWSLLQYENRTWQSPVWVCIEDFWKEVSVINTWCVVTSEVYICGIDWRLIKSSTHTCANLHRCLHFWLILADSDLLLLLPPA